MDHTLWLAFAASSLFIALVPGPGVLNILGYALTAGRKTAFAAVAGAVAGNVISASVSLSGLSGIVHYIPGMLRAIGAAGGFYLIYLGISAIRRARNDGAVKNITTGSVASPRSAFMTSIAVSALNPKSVIFFLAYLPRFISAEGSYFFQGVILILTFAAVVALSDAAYVLTAISAMRHFRSGRFVTRSRRAGGFLFIGLGIFIAATSFT